MVVLLVEEILTQLKIPVDIRNFKRCPPLSLTFTEI